MFKNDNTDTISDVVLKVSNLWVGIGDKFLVNGTDFDHSKDLEKLILAEKEICIEVSIKLCEKI